MNRGDSLDIVPIEVNRHLRGEEYEKQKISDVKDQNSSKSYFKSLRSL